MVFHRLPLNIYLTITLSLNNKILQLYKRAGQKSLCNFAEILCIEKVKWNFTRTTYESKYFMKTIQWSSYSNLKYRLSIYKLCCTVCNHLLLATKNCTLQNSNDISKCRVLISSCLKVNHHYNAASIHGSTYLHCQDNLHGAWLF